MTVEVVQAFSSAYLPNGATTEFAFDFKVDSVDQIKVIDGDGAEVSSSLYTVTLNAGEGGTVTFSTAPTSADYPEIRIVSNPDFTQTREITNTGSGYDPATLEKGLDEAATRDIYLKSQADRALKVPIGETAPDVASLASANGRVLGVVNGKVEAIENDPAAAEDAAQRAETALSGIQDANALGALDYLASAAAGVAGGEANTVDGDTFGVVTATGDGIAVYNRTATGSEYTGFTLAGQAALTAAQASAAQAYSLAVLSQSDVAALEARIAAVEGNCPPSPGWIDAVRFDDQGWFMEVDITAPVSASFDLSKLALAIRTWGYNESGVKVVQTRSFKPTVAMRQPYPNENSQDIVVNGATSTYKFALPEEVFAKETALATVDGAVGINPKLVAEAGFFGADAPAQVIAVDNQSSVPYPDGVARNALPPHRLLDEGWFEVGGGQAAAQQGRTFASARLTLTGQTSGVVYDEHVSSMVASDYFTGHDVKAPVFQAKLSTTDFANFTQEETVTERWRLYPFIGDQVTDSADGAGLASGEFSNHEHVVNHAGTFTRVYAAVDPVNGDNATGVVSEVEATAVATPFETEREATQAAYVYNRDTVGRDSQSGIEIVFVDGETHILTSIKSVSDDIPVDGTWAVYRPVTGATNCNLVNNATVARPSLPRRSCIRGFGQFELTAASLFGIDGSELPDFSYGQMIWFDGTPFVENGVASGGYGLYQAGLVYMTNMTQGSTVQNTYDQGNRGTEVLLLRDVDLGTPIKPPAPWAWFGVKAQIATNPIITTPSNNLNRIQPNDGVVIAGFKFQHTAAGNTCLSTDGQDQIERGFVLMNGLIESWGTDQPSLRVSADGENARVKNRLLFNLTIVGERANLDYEDTFVMADDGNPWQQLKRGLRVVSCVFAKFNTKHDLFPPENGARVHAWNSAFHVGWSYVRLLETTNDGSTAPGVGNWAGEAWTETMEYIGPDARSQFEDWQADYHNATTGGVTGTGNGNYMPSAGSVLLNVVPEAARPCSVDMFGNAFAGALGAIERV